MDHLNRARSEERNNIYGIGSRRSQSEGPLNRRGVSDNPNHPMESEPLISQDKKSYPPPANSAYLARNAAHKWADQVGLQYSSEYKRQFAWPLSAQCTPRKDVSAAPRKSQSMGTIQPAVLGVHTPRKVLVEAQRNGDIRIKLDEADVCQDEKINGDLSEREKVVVREYKSEYKKRFRPFSAYQYVENKGVWLQNSSFDSSVQYCADDGRSWLAEVKELRKKAGEYKHRGWGSELTPDHIAEIYSKRLSLLDQVSRKSELEALALAIPPRAITKEQKEKENGRKKASSFKSRARSTEGPKQVDKKSSKKPTTMPVTGTSPLQVSSIDTGPAASTQSPKRASNRPSKSAAEKRPRPTSLATSQTHSKSNSIPSRGDDKTTQLTKSRKTGYSAAHDKDSVINKVVKNSDKGGGNIRNSGGDSVNVSDQKVSDLLSKVSSEKRRHEERKCDNSKSSDSLEGPAAIHSSNSISLDKVDNQAEPVPFSKTMPDAYERIVKSPPEPTRVRSPEQILVKSPDPVNWTVPLDTGKMFTVTQNLPKGDITRTPKIMSPQPGSGLGTPTVPVQGGSVLQSRTESTCGSPSRAISSGGGGPTKTLVTKDYNSAKPVSHLPGDSMTSQQPSEKTQETKEPVHPVLQGKSGQKGGYRVLEAPVDMVLSQIAPAPP